MVPNNEAFYFYEKMMEGHTNNNAALFESSVRQWLDLGLDSPFEYDTSENEYYYQMQRAHSVWRRQGCDQKINRRRMIAAATELAKLNLPNPYTKVKTVNQPKTAAYEPEEEKKTSFLQRLFRKG